MKISTGARKQPRGVLWACHCLLLGLTIQPILASNLDSRVGGREIRVYSAPFDIEAGRDVVSLALPERLDRLGYRRVHHRPKSSGEYFWGHEVFWIYQREHRIGGSEKPERLFGLQLDRETGRIESVVEGSDEPKRWLQRTPSSAWLEPELIAESLQGDRAERPTVSLEELPEFVWRSVLAAEDHRFFEHEGIDPRGIARAAVKNVIAGKVVQGGSTITQQLVKMRDLTPKRTFTRKLSEAARAIWLEREYGKEEILESYLNHVYLGHRGGLGVYGIEAASFAYFGIGASKLSLSRAATLAAMIQGPNRLNPERGRDQLLARQRWILGRLAELDWGSGAMIGAAIRGGLPSFNPRTPRPEAGARLLGWLRKEVEAAVPKRVAEGEGLIVTTGLDPLLQDRAKEAVRSGLELLRRQSPGLRSRPLSAALVALDARSGDVLAYVGGDPADLKDRFDRVRSASRQPGSTIKPLVLLEAFESCGRRSPLHPATRLSDRPFAMELPTGTWRPENPDNAFREVVTVREALLMSLNVPFVRAARWCGLDATGIRLEAAGLALPRPIPPSFVLGALEVSPLDLAASYTVIAGGGRRLEPLPLRRVNGPRGRRLLAKGPKSRKVASETSAYLIRSLLQESEARYAAEAGGLSNEVVFGKTGTSSGQRDAWFVGGAGSVVAAVWVGLDEGGGLARSGRAAAAPIWHEFMQRGVPARPRMSSERPRQIVSGWVDDESGYSVSGPAEGARRYEFRKGTRPPHRWLPGRAGEIAVIE